MESVRDKRQDFIDKAKLVHGDKYNYDQVDYKTARIKVKIKCSMHGIFEQVPDIHTSNKSGCPKCSIEKIANSNRLTNEEFIEKARKIHGDLYDYSKVDYKKSIIPVIIICSQHGEFQQKPNDHLCGQICRICNEPNISKSTRKSKDKFIEEVSKIHNNKYDYSKVVYKNCKTYIIIICPKHGEFQQTPGDHIKGGCKKCGDEYRGLCRRSTTDEFIKKSKEIHGDLYDYGKVIYERNDKDVCIICIKHGEFLQKPCVHINLRCGCPKCGIEKMADSNRLTLDEFINRACEIHNNEYDYSKVVYYNAHTKITITCSKHGDFNQDPNSHLNGNGCQLCGYERSGVCYNGHPNYACRLTLDEFLQKAKEIHGNVYDYSKFIYTKSIEKSMIICPKHGEFEQAPMNHLAGSGCRICGTDNTKLKRRKTTEQFVKDAKAIHNERYIYDKVLYTNAYTNIVITCPDHGDFVQRPANHLNGKGCRKCNIGTSKNSMEWLNMVKTTYPDLQTYDDVEGEYRIPHTNYSVDGYDKKTNTVFEFHGDYWHGNPTIFQSEKINPSTKCTFGELYNKTLNKRKILEDLGYKYIEVWENKWNILKRVILAKQKSIRTNRPLHVK